MSGHQLTFPPPPPAPPKASPSWSRAPQSFALGVNGAKGKGNSKDYGNRGHRPGFNRGGGRCGHFDSTQSSSIYGNPSMGIDKRHSSLPNISHNIQTNDYRRSGYPLPHYSPIQLPQFPANVFQGYGSQNQEFPPNTRQPIAAHPANGSGSYKDSNGQHEYSSHGYGPSFPTVQSPLPATRSNTPFRTNVHPSQPVLMGPPIRMGFDARRSGSQAQHHTPPTANGTKAYEHGISDGSESPYRHNSSLNLGPGGHASLSAFPGDLGRGQRRGQGGNYHRPRDQNYRTQVAPAVPSFGSQLPLPLKPPATHGNTRKLRRKKRKHNLLGLTPKAEEYESSEEEDDTDEEAKLAALASSTRQGHKLLQFSYKGRTSTLQSSSDITAWIEERKKRFPTKARAAEIVEAKRQSNKQQRAADKGPREAHEKHKSELRKRKRQKTEGEKQQKTAENPFEDAAAKSKRKIEKLRRQLEREEKRIAKAEAHRSKDKVEYDTGADETEISALSNENKRRKRSGSRRFSNAKIEDTDRMKPKLQEAASIGPDPLTPTSQPALADEEPCPLPKALKADDQVSFSIGQDDDKASSLELDRPVYNSSDCTSDSSSASASPSSEDSSTSSGGSSSDGDSDHEAPNETSTKRDRPERVAPPKRAKSKQICRAFLHKGLCRRGSCCKYLHELPERGKRRVMSPAVKRAEGRRVRVGLYQRLVEQEKKQEDHKVIEAIVHLGEKGLSEDGVQAINGDGKVG